MEKQLSPSPGVSEALKSVPNGSVAGARVARTSLRLRVFVPSLIALTFLSTLAGFLAGHFQDALAHWMKIHQVAAAVPQQAASALVSTPELRKKNADLEEISRLAPQQQAERLLELAIERPELSLELIRRNLTAWRGHLEDTDRLFQLVLAALDSEDPRVRVAAVEIDLAASKLIKSPESITKLEHEIQGDSDERYMALWRLGALGNRGVEPLKVLQTLKLYAHDRNQKARFWAVEGLAMLGSREAIDALLDTLAHDAAPQIRERAATSLAKSGLLTGEQRLAAVPQLLNLLDDDSLDAATQKLVCSTLEAITGASFGRNASAWREWWAHHDRPQKRRPSTAGLTLA
jgi:HEAT repeats